MKIKKIDKGFVCEICGKVVEPLGYTSRDHCPKCLCSKHVDELPGDRQNECEGTLVPVSVEYSESKGYIIEYLCQKCKQIKRNKASNDDSKKMLLSVMNGTYDKEIKKLK